MALETENACTNERPPGAPLTGSSALIVEVARWKARAEQAIAERDGLREALEKIQLEYLDEDSDGIDVMFEIACDALKALASTPAPQEAGTVPEPFHPDYPNQPPWRDGERSRMVGDTKVYRSYGDYVDD